MGSMGVTIPGPRGLPLLGNMLDMWQDRDMPLRGLERLADLYGPIYRVTLGGKSVIVCSSAALLEEIANEKIWAKVPPSQISDEGRPDGLFAARNEDPDWAQGHRILMPAFAPLSVQDMFSEMKDIANQLILSWARKGPENRILATEDFTKLTLDTIALCTMNYRFNSFYTEGTHPFLAAMTYVFSENTARTTRPGIMTKVMTWTAKERARCQGLMREIGQKIIDERRANPTDKKDVLNAMLFGKDPKTGQVMRDELIGEQMITFLIAGHETTSGLLSFATMYLLTNPSTYLKAQQEMDEVIGSRAIEAGDLSKLKYLNAVLREAVRLSPTVPVLQKSVQPELANQIHMLGGKYQIMPDDRLVVLLAKAQTDPKVWGETARDFEPERMLDENFDKVMAQYPGSWKPFGNGKRACIGRPFAWQEALLVMAMMLQNFDVKLDDPAYKLSIKQNLTVKPGDLYIRVSARKNMSATAVDVNLHGNGVLDTNTAKENGENASTEANSGGPPLLILYGSNTGTCQAFAQRLASDAAGHGFTASIKNMDSATDEIPKNIPVIVITSSYEGQPPDNAARFVEWLQVAKDSCLEGVMYTVFGCGHHDWSSTFHRVPKLVDEQMSRLGGTRFSACGFTDAAKGTMYSDFEEWLDGSLWASLAPKDAPGAPIPSTTVKISTNARASSLRYDVSVARVKENRVLTHADEPTKCHLEIELPSEMSYECGDYLAILPLNSEHRVRQILAHFRLPWDATITLQTTGPSSIPANTPLSAFDVLRSYVELSQPATKKNLRILAAHAHDSDLQAKLLEVSSDDTLFNAEITSKRASVFDLVTQSSIDLPFGDFLGMLPPLQVRQYSISSSPLANQGHCTISYGVIDRAALSGASARFQGVTGSYLQSLAPGDTIQVSVRPTAKKTFRLPADLEKTPLLMFAAGTGVAPFRGFIQERSLKLQASPGTKLAPALLFLGCRSPVTDRIYAEELDAWVKQGAVSVKYAFSKDTDNSSGCRYVPDRMVKEADELVLLWRQGARAYICGTRVFSQGVGQAARVIAGKAREKMVAEGGNDAEMMKILEERFNEAIQARVASDVFD